MGVLRRRTRALTAWHIQVRGLSSHAEQIVDDPSFWHRLQFGFTIVYHYLFPQLTLEMASLPYFG
jgi:hypothetical protein